MLSDESNNYLSTGVTLAPEDESQQTTVTNQNYNYFNNLRLNNLGEGLVLRPGPDVAGQDSGSTYHNIGGGAGTSFYVKESGSGNTGRVCK